MHSDRSAASFHHLESTNYVNLSTFFVPQTFKHTGQEMLINSSPVLVTLTHWLVHMERANMCIIMKLIFRLSQAFTFFITQKQVWKELFSSSAEVIFSWTSFVCQWAACRANFKKKNSLNLIPLRDSKLSFEPLLISVEWKRKKETDSHTDALKPVAQSQLDLSGLLEQLRVSCSM